jgi:hypothetical protein
VIGSVHILFIDLLVGLLCVHGFILCSGQRPSCFPLETSHAETCITTEKYNEIFLDNLCCTCIVGSSVLYYNVRLSDQLSEIEILDFTKWSGQSTD